MYLLLYEVCVFFLEQATASSGLSAPNLRADVGKWTSPGSAAPSQLATRGTLTGDYFILVLGQLAVAAPQQQWQHQQEQHRGGGKGAAPHARRGGCCLDWTAAAAAAAAATAQLTSAGETCRLTAAISLSRESTASSQYYTIQFQGLKVRVL